MSDTTKTTASVPFDDALNEAGWKLHEELAKHGPIQAHVFNWCKPALREAIAVWLAARAKQEAGK